MSNDFVQCILNLVSCQDVWVSSLDLKSKDITTAVPLLKVQGYQLTRLVESTDRVCVDPDEALVAKGRNEGSRKGLPLVCARCVRQ